MSFVVIFCFFAEEGLSVISWKNVPVVWRLLAAACRWHIKARSIENRTFHFILNYCCTVSPFPEFYAVSGTNEAMTMELRADSLKGLRATLLWHCLPSLKSYERFLQSFHEWDRSQSSENRLSRNTLIRGTKSLQSAVNKLKYSLILHIHCEHNSSLLPVDAWSFQAWS